jgi:signal transduction histidine kinase
MKHIQLIFFAIFFLQIFAFSNPEEDKRKVVQTIDSLEVFVYTTPINNQTRTDLLVGCNKLMLLYRQLSDKKQIEYATRLQMITDRINDPDLTIKILQILADAHYKLDNNEEAIEINYKIFNLYSIQNDEVNTAKALMNIGHNYYNQNKYIKAKDYYERALSNFKKNQYFTGIAESLQRLALILSHWGEYDEALNHNFEALNFWKEIGDILQIANVNFSIGTIYQELGDLDRAKECFHKSLNLYQELNSTFELVKTTSHIGDIYLEEKQYDEALEYYQKAQYIGKQANSIKLKAEAAFNIGKAYNLKGDHYKAIDYQREALKLNEELGDKKALAENYAELGLVYFNFTHYDRALYYFKKGLDISLEINYKFQNNIYYQYLSEVHAILGNYEEAYRNYKLYIAGRDQISSEEAKQKTAELQAKYQLSVKEKENERLRHNEQLHRAQIKNQWLLMGFVAFALVLLIVLATIFRRRYQQNRRLNVQLSLKNNEIENHRKKVEHLNADLQEANAAKDRFFSIIAHDLKNPFNSLMGLVDLLIEEYHSFKEKEQMEFLHQIKASSDKIYALLQNLLMWGSNQLGKTQVVKEKIDLSKTAKESVTLIQSLADNKNITLEMNIPPNTWAYADKNMVSTILLNLITNAIKFTPQDGTVEVQCFNKTSHVEVMVADSGVGISPKNLEQLFKIDAKVQSTGTDNEKGTGLGLILCKEFIEKNNGRIWAESIEGSGSWFYFTLPVSEDAVIEEPISPSQKIKFSTLSAQ